MAGPSRSNLFLKTFMLFFGGQIIFSFLPINGLACLLFLLCDLFVAMISFFSSLFQFLEISETNFLKYSLNYFTFDYVVGPCLCGSFSSPGSPFF
jgi:hypothetical protein